MNRFLLTAALLLTGGAAMAQGGPGQGGFPGGPGGFRGGGPGGPGGRMMGARTVTAASLPLKVLATYLNLDDAQVGKIALVREDAQEAMRPQMPQRRSGQGDGQPGQPPSFQDMQARAQSADRKAASDIANLLNDTQRRRLTTLVKAIKALQDEGIRPDAAVKLRLTDEQLTRLASGGKSEAVLTDEQQTIAQSYTMPQGPGGPGFGGPGGPGGFPGGPGGPPPGFGGNQ